MNQTDFALTYTLKAQTPMLHFQAKQQGATLRATEVKPKLDGFIIQTLGVENVPQSWFISGTNSLNYKLRFTADGEGTISEPHRSFYGNAGKFPDHPEYTWALKGDCTMRVLCFIPELRQTIDQLVEEFFICNNFGRMQSKGFGNFVIARGTTYQEAEIGQMLCKSTGASACYTFDAGSNDRFTLDDIQVLYTVMKSGFNRVNHQNPRQEQYHRSYLFEYFHQQNVGNEKAAMKKEGIAPAAHHPNNQHTAGDQDFDPYCYVRALLGIADHFEYITDFEWRANRQGVYAYLPVKTKETVLISSEEVKRFASPVFFKVIGRKVYMVANRIHPEILGKEFTFTNKTTGKSVVLSTPAQFDIDGFMDWFVTQYNRDMQNISPDARNTYSIQKPITIAYSKQGGNTNA